MKTLFYLVLFISFTALFLSVQGCSQDNPAQEYNMTPAQDPNDFDRMMARKYLPPSKLNHPYKYKRSYDSFISTGDYLDKHGADGVTQSTGSTASSLTMKTTIYSDTLANLYDAD